MVTLSPHYLITVWKGWKRKVTANTALHIYTHFLHISIHIHTSIHFSTHLYRVLDISTHLFPSLQSPTHVYTSFPIFTHLYLYTFLHIYPHHIYIPITSIHISSHLYTSDISAHLYTSLYISAFPSLQSSTHL